MEESSDLYAFILEGDLEYDTVLGEIPDLECIKDGIESLKEKE